MFGYIRPMQGELKVRELESFKSCYCGLCRTLGKQYGLLARFVLSYELVFLSMLLWEPEDKPVINRRVCIASPCRKKCYCVSNEALRTCAGYNVIFAWWRLRDNIADEPFIRALPYRIASLALRRAYKKASSDFPAFDAKIRSGLADLAGYEANEGQSLDGAADKFAVILKAAAPDAGDAGDTGEDSDTGDNAVTGDTGRFRALPELLYHLGRWIYITDACDDCKSDVKAGRYNPVAARYPPENGEQTTDSVERLRLTLTHSNNRLCSAFELLQENVWTDTVRNIIYLGMPYVCDRVLVGKWPPRSRRM